MQGPVVAGRRALVTGASRGIGAAVAERLAAEGASVAISARTVDRPARLPGTLHETRRRLEAYGHPIAVIAADLTDEDQRTRLVERAADELGGPIEVLVNNAAVAIPDSAASMSSKRQRLSFDANVLAPIALTQAVLPAMRVAKEGWIVNVSSSASRILSISSHAADAVHMDVYGATKAALDRVMNGLAIELSDTGVRINTVKPTAAVMTEGLRLATGDRLAADAFEPVEQFVEAVLALSRCAPEVTGNVFVSGELLRDWKIETKTLDGLVQI